MSFSEPICVEDIERIASAKLEQSTRGYYFSGADQEQTLRDNVQAFQRYRLRPRVLRDVSVIKTETTVLGEKISFPLCVAPTGLHCLSHPEGERATAKACARMGICMALSCGSSCGMEEVAQVSPDGLKWFQLYVMKDEAMTRSLIRRAESSGYKALVITVDTPVVGNRYADAKNKFTLPPHVRQVNYSVSQQATIQPTSHTHRLRDGSATADMKSTVSEKERLSGTYAATLFEPTLNWNHVAWLKTVTSLPLVLKGIMTAEDARIAVDYGVAGIVVSNHGGRQLDGALASIDAVAEVARAVGSRCEVYMDGGVRLGTDVLKALALGAKAVFVGRPALWGLAYKGQEGVERVLQILHDEFTAAMKLAGCVSVETISSDLLIKQNVLYARL